MDFKNLISVFLKTAAILFTLVVLLLCNVCRASVLALAPDKTKAISIISYGAKADGSDATTAIQNAIHAAQTASHAVYVPPGNYLCGSLKLDGVYLIGEGAASILTAADPAHAKITLDGSNVGILNLKLYTKSVKRVPGQDRIQVDSTTDSFCISNVTIDGSNATGMIIYGSNGRITQNRVFNTKADSIHMSGEAHDLYVAGNLVRNSGDDCISVVTYDQKNPNPTNCHDILIENNDVGDQIGGRGISVVGGDHVTIRNNRIRRTAWAGIYLASEPHFQTRGVTNVIVENNLVDSNSRLFPQAKHQAIFIYSGTNFVVSDVKVIKNQVTNAPTGPFHIGSKTRNIFFEDNTYNGQAVQPREATGRGNGVIGATITSSLLGGQSVPAPASIP